MTRPHPYGAVTIEGKRTRKTFASRKDAENFVAGFTKRKSLVGLRAGKLRDDDLHDAVEAMNILDGRASLTRAARFYVKHVGKDAKSLTVSDAIREYFEMSEGQELREKSMQDLRLRLGRFAESFGNFLITDVTRREVTEWLTTLPARNGDPLSAMSKRHFKVVCGALFNYAIEQEYLMENPFVRRTRSRRKQEGEADQTLPSVLTPDQVKKVMRAAEEYSCNARAAGVESMVPAFAIGFFAGIRTAELTRITWEDVDVHAKRITVPPTVAKRRSVRYVDMEPNLVAWLTPHKLAGGFLTPRGGAWRFHFDAVRNMVPELQWPHNCMRHCFATYHLAKYGDRRLTEIQLGHHSHELLYTHYRALATRAEGELYFSIRPKRKVASNTDVEEPAADE